MGNYLDYTLDTGIDGQLKFQIQYQSKKVNKFMDFLKAMGKKYYLTESGYKVAISKFPEFKISKNTIYLRGTLKSQDNKVDVTRFPDNSTYRKGGVKMFKSALNEFIAEVEKADKRGLLSDYDTYTVYNNRLSKSNVNPMANLNTVSNVESFLTGVFPTVDIYRCEPLDRRSIPTSNVTYISL